MSSRRSMREPRRCFRCTSHLNIIWHLGIAGAWEALLAYDCIIFCLTIFKTWTTRPKHTPTWDKTEIPLITLLLRDGMSECIQFFLRRRLILRSRGYILCVGAVLIEALFISNWLPDLGCWRYAIFPTFWHFTWVIFPCLMTLHWLSFLARRGMRIPDLNSPLRNILIISSLSCAETSPFLRAGE